jgi:hypothetical protein
MPLEEQLRLQHMLLLLLLVVEVLRLQQVAL